MVKKVNEELMQRFRASLAERGVTRDYDQLESYPVGAAHVESVPFVGTVHLPTKRMAKRIRIDRLFKKLKF